MKYPKKSLENRLLKAKYNAVIGVDEVGMGCLAGPVVACAVSFDKKFYEKQDRELKTVTDSKKLSSKERERLANLLKNNKYIHYKISLCSPKQIDRLNIHKASKRAMKKAVLSIASQGGPIVLVDGLHEIPSLNIDQQTIVKGDQKVFVIACASILAKVHRDRIMTRYAKKYPDYGFEIHKGYGTKLHYSKLQKNGPSPIHRLSFRLK